MQRERSRPSANPSMKTLVRVAGLILVLFCKGVLTQPSHYTLTVPEAIRLQQGSCFQVPCRFTVPARYTASREPMYAYWFKIEKKRYYLLWINIWVLGELMATNDKRQKVNYAHFKLTGDPEQGDCSFSIMGTSFHASGRYYLRIDKGEQYRHVFTSTHTEMYINPQVIVTGPQKPIIWKSSEISWGKQATFSCKSQNYCPEDQPQIVWSTKASHSSTSQWSRPESSSSWTFGTDISFTPSVADEGTALTCRITHPPTRKSENTIKLSMAYQPKIVDAQPDIRCRNERSGFLCTCAFHSWPPPQIEWEVDGKHFSENKSSEGLRVISQAEGNVVRSSLKLEESQVKAGEHSISCSGSNHFGTNTLSLPSYIRTDPPAKMSPWIIFGITIGNLALLTTITAALRYFFFHRQLPISPKDITHQKDAPASAQNAVMQFSKQNVHTCKAQSIYQGKCTCSDAELHCNHK